MSALKKDLYFTVVGYDVRERKDKDKNVIGVFTQIQSFYTRNDEDVFVTIALPEVLNEKEIAAIEGQIIYLNETDHNLQFMDDFNKVLKADSYKILTDKDIAEVAKDLPAIEDLDGAILNINVDLVITKVINKPNKDEPAKSKVKLQSRYKEGTSLKVREISIKEQDFTELVGLKGKTVRISNINVAKIKPKPEEAKKGKITQTFYSTTTMPTLIK